MKRLSLYALLAMTLAAGPVLAVDVPAKNPAASAAKAAVPAKPSMAENGRFHALHKAKDVECSDCHSTDNVDPLFLRAAESQGSKGPVNRAECMDCHTSPKKLAWYRGVKK